MGDNNSRNISFYNVCLVERSLRTSALAHFLLLRESALVVKVITNILILKSRKHPRDGLMQFQHFTHELLEV